MFVVLLIQDVHESLMPVTTAFSNERSGVSDIAEERGEGKANPGRLGRG